MKKFNLIIGLLVATLVFTSCNKDKSVWLVKIDGKKISKKDVLDSYEAYLMLQSSQRQIPIEQLRKIAENVQNESDPEKQRLGMELSKAGFLEQYKNFLLLNMEAKKTGFVNRKLKYMQMFFLANLFLQEKVPTDNVQISDKDAIKAWNEAKKKNPGYRTIPLDKGVKFMKGKIAAYRRQVTMKQQFETLNQKYRILQNEEAIKKLLGVEELTSDTKGSTKKEEKNK